MNKEQFNEIKSKATNKRKPSELAAHNIKVFRYRVNCDADSHEFRWMYEDINSHGNDYKTNEEAERFMIDLLELDVFTEEQWEKLLPHIDVFEFNKEYDKVFEQLLPTLNELMKMKFYDCLHLEFWQGALSLGGHWCNPDGKNFNYPENGEKYKDCILKIKEIITPLLQKYNCHHTLMDRLCHAGSSILSAAWF